MPNVCVPCATQCRKAEFSKLSPAMTRMCKVIPLVRLTFNGQNRGPRDALYSSFFFHLIIPFSLHYSLPHPVPGAGVAVPQPARVPAGGHVALHGPSQGGHRQQGPGVRHVAGGARQNVPVSQLNTSTVQRSAKGGP